jgi:lysozyme
VGRFDVITREVAEQLLRSELEFMSNQIKATMNQNQFDALCSFAYNCGIKALLRSTLYRKVKANPADSAIQAEFMKWTKAGGHVLDGLVKRRAAEWNLYNT